MTESELPGSQMTRATLGPDGRIVRDITPQRRSLFRRIVRARMYYLLLAPSVLLLLIFNYYPAFLAFYDSLFKVDYGLNGVFIGLANFINLFKDPEFLGTIPRVLQLTVFSAVTVITVPVIVAEWIFRLQSKRAQYFYRILMIWPAIVPGVVTILIWQFIYDPYSGLLNALLRFLGLGSLTQDWLGDPNIALYSVMGSSFPFVGGIAVLIYLAGLQSISSEVFDSAAMDGAHGIRRFFSIDLPLIIGQIKLNLVLAIISSVQNFAGILILTNGGPANATEVPGLYMYKVAFQYNEIGYASAIGVLIFLCILVLTFLNMRYLRERA
jgi:raffinose/stachyose/melibiose transport system permease protein